MPPSATNRREQVRKRWEILLDFEEAWERGQALAIDEYLPLVSAAERQALLIDLVNVDLERRLKAGQAVRVEGYLQRYPELAAQPKIVLALLAAEYHQRRREPGLALAEYLARFPAYEHQLRALLDEYPARPADAPGTTSDNRKDPHGPGTVDEVVVKLPQCIGRYRVENILGQGAFGLVYLAHDDQLQRPVAVKVPHPHLIASPKDADAYLAEARTAAGLDHPHIVPVFDVGSTADFPCFVVSKFIEGRALAVVLRHDRFASTAAAALVATIAEALQHAHQRGVVHRDIKPGNILLDAAGRPFVADFGLALRDQDVGHGPRYVGTPAYMSPEQARGEGHRVDGRTDVFSLGVVFYELLTGRRPFHADSWEELLEQIATHEPRPPRQRDGTVPKELERICLKALSKRASERYTTAKDMGDDVRHFLEQPTDEEEPALRSRAQAAGMPAPASTSAPVAGPPPTPTSASQPVKIVPKGLRSFDAYDADFFLELLPGPRDREGLPDSIRFWKARIEETDPEKTFAVGLICGPSGCGKSSLVKAGLLPRLSDRVLAVYLEATAEGTETRLRNGLCKRCPALPVNLGLKEALASLRCGPGLRPGKKVLLVLDQFEQWLHAWRDADNSELVQALRQCDGGRVQCVVLVRDDFWMAVLRFLRELEVRLVAGQNSAAVDLFPLRHAEKVLAAFGRAFGALPESSDAIGKNQQQFLGQAVQGLAQDGKVICVRLALFAEMMKAKAWMPATLKEVGGIGGVGVTFLEETFSASTALPEHRYHQKAARAVLKALLPETGTDIKGSMRSHAELLAASGYASLPKEFNELLRILDGELRLITPTDPEDKEDAAPSAVQAGAKYYQLTHDYLVHSLRDWLTRKQKETRRGRAELRLAERAAFWGAKQESRQLPGKWEWLNLILYTRPKDRTALERRMLRAANWRNLLQAGVLLVLLALVGWGVWEVWRGPVLAAQLVEKLASAEVRNVPQIVEELASCRDSANLRLKKMLADSKDESKEHFHASLALLPVDDGQKEYLIDRMLKADTDPDEFEVICDALRKHSREFPRQLWIVLENEADPKRWFHAACALAYFEPSHSDWPRFAGRLADQLVRENQLYSLKWCNFLVNIRNHLVEPMEKIVLSPDRSQEDRAHMAQLIPKVFTTQAGPKFILDLALGADGSPYEVLKLWFLARPEVAAELLKAELEKLPEPDESEEAREKRAKRQAHAAVMLLHFQEEEYADLGLPDPWPKRIWSLFWFPQDPDPRLRAYLIHRPGRVNSDPETFIRQFEVEKEASPRRALLLSLGEYSNLKLSKARRQSLATTLLHTYQDDPDPGIHSAVDWLLRRWGGERLPEIDQELALAGPQPGKRRWYITQQGHTLAMVNYSRVEFQMGSPDKEPDRQADETPHRRRISRSFALATKEVTVKQFQQFLQANPGIRRDGAVNKKLNQNPDGPITGVTWFEAAQYCRWLSEKEGIPEDQQCYPPIHEIKPGMRMPDDYLARTGYRLPTEAEWEYTCRAGAVTSRHYGVAEELLGNYARYSSNSEARTWPVGSRKPNDYGLFDMLGNAWEWCQDVYAPYADRGVAPLEDCEDNKPITASDGRVLRGGDFASGAGDVRSAARSWIPPTTIHLPRAGLRIARTCR